MLYHVWLCSDAPGAVEFDGYFQAPNVTAAIEKAEKWARKDANGYQAVVVDIEEDDIEDGR